MTAWHTNTMFHAPLVQWVTYIYTSPLENKPPFFFFLPVRDKYTNKTHMANLLLLWDSLDVDFIDVFIDLLIYFARETPRERPLNIKHRTLKTINAELGRNVCTIKRQHVMFFCQDRIVDSGWEDICSAFVLCHLWCTEEWDKQKKKRLPDRVQSAVVQISTTGKQGTNDGEYLLSSCHNGNRHSLPSHTNCDSTHCHDLETCARSTPRQLVCEDSDLDPHFET